VSAVQPISAGPQARIARLVAALVVRQRLAALETARRAMPLDHPYRHDLDFDADTRFAAIACACPDPCACDPKDGTAK
jgi:hypothetical protein